ncbi:MAG: DegV family protein [Spirochaetales bacterium]|nr:DegV family protein [Spirochaetales bacterium]
MSTTLMNGYQIYHGFLSGFMNINNDRQYLNKINVFPVADGDTGNNMVRTISMIVKRLESSRSASAVLSDIARISLYSARGNSGMIFSQYLNGLALYTAGKDKLTLEDFGQAAQKSVSLAYESIDNPVEGTMLTVLKAWSESIYQGSMEKRNPDDIFHRAFKRASTVLEKTRDQLQVLKENNVLDAGASGFVSFLKGMENLRFSGPVPLSLRKNVIDSSDRGTASPVISRHKATEKPQYRYCTEMLLNTKTAHRNKLRKDLIQLGDSLIINEGLDRTRIHIHTNCPHEVATRLKKYGTLSEQKADDMIRQEQVVNNRKSSIAVLTDSIADIPQEILDTEQIHVLNHKLSWGEDEFLDRVTITPEQFYREQSRRKEFPGSSLPDAERVKAVYQYLTDYYDGIIVLPVAKSLSGTWNQMTKTAEPYNSREKKIAVIDTCLNSAAQGLLVREIARQANEGKSLKELTESAEVLKRKIHIYVSVSTFKYMVKGGRVSPMKGYLAAFLHLKPIVTLNAVGKGTAFDKAFTRKGLLKKISGIISETARIKGIRSYAVVHAADPAKAEQFARSIEQATGLAPDYMSSISPIVGMHSGQGAIAVAVITG